MNLQSNGTHFYNSAGQCESKWSLICTRTMNFPVKEKYYVANAVKTKWKKRFMA